MRNQRTKQTQTLGAYGSITLEASGRRSGDVALLRPLLAVGGGDERECLEVGGEAIDEIVGQIGGWFC